MFQTRVLLPCVLVFSMTASCDQRPATNCVDADGDGYGAGCAAGADCDDGDPAVHPGAPEPACSDVDYDCDGQKAACAPALWTHVSAGGEHTCALDDAGTAYCWGGNRTGQLGLGHVGGATTAPAPVDVSALPAGTRISRISAGARHSCAVDTTGVVYCWGTTDSGRLGQPLSAPIQPLPLAIDPAAFAGDAVVDVAAGEVSTCAVTAGGRVFCWGSGYYGELGVDAATALSPVEARVPATSTFVGISAGYHQACARSSDGEVYCWGRFWGPYSSGFTDTSTPTLVNGGPHLQVALGQDFHCTSSDTLDASCSGIDAYGQFGAGPDTGSWAAVDTSGIAGFTGFASLTAGARLTCGILLDGGAYCWGDGETGAVGDGAATGPTFYPSAVDASGLGAGETWSELSIGHDHVCGVTSRGALLCWGSDAWDQLGDGGERVSSPAARPVDTSALGTGEVVTKVSAGDHHACELTSLGRVLCWGRNLDGQLGTGATGGASRRPAPISTASITGDTRFVDVTAGRDHSCAITADGAAYCWGADTGGQLGDDETRASQASPTPVDRTVVSGDGKLALVFAGRWKTCAIANDGSGYCWGVRSSDVSTSASVGTPRRIDTSGLGGDSRLVQIDPYYVETCATTADGRGVCWGSGALGDGTLGSSLVPVAIDLSGVTGSTTVRQMVHSQLVGQMYSCALMDDGAAYCFGSELDLLGLGYTPDASVLSPVAVDTTGIGGGGFRALAAGVDVACGLDDAGAPVCWGWDDHQLLGGSSEDLLASSPVRLDVGSLAPAAFTQISLQLWTACALDATGRAFCWGQDPYGELGDGGATPWQSSPVAVRHP